MELTEVQQIRRLLEEHKEEYLEGRKAQLEVVQRTIAEKVNGRIEALRIENANQFTSLTDSIHELKASVKPAVELVTNLRGFSKVTFYILTFIGTVSGIVFAALQVKWK